MTNKMDFPLITIGIPTYNRYEQLSRVIDTAVGQTYPNIEIIIGDNSDSENIPEEIECKLKSALSIRYFKHSVNLGAEANHQFLFDHAKGDYFIFFHDDDEYPKDSLEKLISGFSSELICLVAPKVERRLEGNHYFNYNDYSTIGVDLVQRTKDAILNAFSEHFYMNEHLFNGLYKKKFGNIKYLRIHKFEPYLVLQYALLGEVITLQNVCFVKNTSKIEQIKYWEGSGRIDYYLLKLFDYHNEFSTNRLLGVSTELVMIIGGCHFFSLSQKLYFFKLVILQFIKIGVVHDVHFLITKLISVKKLFR